MGRDELGRGQVSLAQGSGPGIIFLEQLLAFQDASLSSFLYVGTHTFSTSSYFFVVVVLQMAWGCHNKDHGARQ